MPTRRIIENPSNASLTRALLCALLLFAGISGCKKAEEPADPVEVSVQAEKAETKDITAYVTADTVLSPLAQAALVPKITAPVKRFLVQRGARIKAGQLLAVLENGDLAAAVTDSKGSLVQAQAAYTTSTKASIPEDLQKAQLEVADTKAQMDVAKSAFDARKNLLDQGAIPRRDFETASSTYVQAKSAYDIAAQHLQSLTGVSQAASIQSAQGALGSANGRYQAAEANLGYSEIRSPIAGVVTDRPLFAGEMAQAGMPIVTVMDTSSLIAKVHVAQSQVASLKVGADALVTVAGIDDPVKGKVSLISPALDAGSTTIEIWIKIPNPAGTLKAGSPAHVQMAVQTDADAITVPNEAVVATKDGAPAVMVIGADGKASARAVKTGITDGKDTEILSGLKAGELVVTKGAYGMDDGTKVKVVAAGAADDDDKKPDADDKKADDAKPSPAVKKKDGDDK